MGPKTRNNSSVNPDPVEDTSDNEGNQNDPPSEEAVVYPVPDNLDTIFVPACERYKALCEVMMALPIEILVRAGKTVHIAALVTLIKSLAEKLEDDASPLERAMIASLSQATINETERKVLAAVSEESRSTSTVPPIWSPSDSVREQLSYFYVLGVPESVMCLAPRENPAGFGQGIPSLGIPPHNLSDNSSVNPTLPSLSNAGIAPPLTRSQLVIPKKDISVKVTNATRPAPTPMSRVEPNTVTTLERELNQARTAGDNIPYNQIFQPGLQHWIRSQSRKIGDYHPTAYESWPHEIMIRWLRDGCAKKPLTNDSMPLAARLQRIVTDCTMPVDNDDDPSIKGAWELCILNELIQVAGSYDALMEQEIEGLRDVLKALQSALKESGTLVASHALTSLERCQAHQLSRFKAWWHVYTAACEEARTIRQNHDALESNREKYRGGNKKRPRDVGGKRNHPKGDSRPPTEAQTPARESTVPMGECYKCGKTHAPKLCRLTLEGPRSGWHPDCNWNYKRRWIESPGYTRWKVIRPDIKSCPLKETAAGGTWPRGTGKKYLLVVQRAHDSVMLAKNTPRQDMQLINSSITSPPFRVVGLLDTGSEGPAQEDNYISEAVADRLEALGIEGKEDGREGVVTSCWKGDDGRLCTRVYNLDVALCNRSCDSNFNQGTFNITCCVMPIEQDLIIGFHTIKSIPTLKYALAKALDINYRHETPVASRSGPDNGDVESTSTEERSRDPSEVDTSNTGRPHVRLVGNSRSRKHRHVNNHSSVLRARKKQLCAATALERVRAASPGAEARSCALTEEVINAIPVKSLHGSSPEKIHALYKLVREYESVFRRGLGRKTAKIKPMEITLIGNSLWGISEGQQPVRMQGRMKAAEIQRQVQEMLDAGIIRHSKANAYSQVLLTPKKDNKWRFCVDYRRLNVSTEKESWPLPRIRDMIDRIGSQKASHYGVLDLTKGYYQAPLSEASKRLSAFITPNGVYEWNRVAMGLKSAPAYFQQAMATEVLGDLLYRICEIYLDDIIVFGATEEEFHTNLRTILQRLQDYNIYANPDKCTFGVEEIEYVGHTISKKGVKFSREKLQRVVEVELPKRAKGLKSFLGLANYFRSHVRNHSSLAAPLQAMITPYHKNNVLHWTPALIQAFNDLKKAINDMPELFFFDDTAPVHLYTDASLTGIGAYLCQKLADGTEIPIAFYSKALRQEERAWGIPCLEAYAIWQAFKNLDYLLRGAKTYVHTDHKNLVYIRESGSEKIIRWKLDLLEYDMELDAIAGVDNPIADYFSRNEGADEHDHVIANARQASHVLAQMTRLSEVDLEKEDQAHKRCLQAMSVVHTSPDEYQCIKEVHNEHDGHHGVETTLHKLAKKGKRWPQMRAQVQRFVKECDCCQKRSYAQYEIRAPHYAVGTYLPMESVSLDLISGLPETPEGYKYILVCIDSFTRFMWATPLKSKGAEEVAEAYLTHAGIFGAPYEFKSDQGREFVNKVMDEVLEVIDAKHTMTLAYNHQENAIVERSNAELVKWITDMIYNRRLQKTAWTKALPFAVRIHNASPVDTIKYSPAELLFGDSVVLDKNILIPKANQRKDIELSTFMKDRRQLQDQMILEAQRTQKSRAAQRADPEEKAITTFKNGQMVLLAYPESAVWKRKRPTKLGMVFRGPYKVLSHEGVEYTLEDLVTHERLKKLVFQLRPYHYDARFVDPQQMALKDRIEEFHVERIVSHSGSWKKIRDMEFVVKWTGYDEPEGGQKWADLKYNRTFRQYLRDQQQQRHIPVAEDESSDSETDEFEAAEALRQQQFTRRTRQRTT
jgi:hypothetical protein